MEGMEDMEVEVGLILHDLHGKINQFRKLLIPSLRTRTLKLIRSPCLIPECFKGLVGRFQQPGAEMPVHLDGTTNHLRSQVTLYSLHDLHALHGKFP